MSKSRDKRIAVQMKKPKNIKDLEDSIVQPEPIITTELEYEIDGVVHEPEMRIHKAGKLERIRNKLVSATTFDFLRHFIIGFAGVGGTVVVTTGNLAWAVIAGVGGGLVEGGRKVWSTSTASKNGGTKNRVLEAVLQLIVALIDMYINKRKEAKDD